MPKAVANSSTVLRVLREIVELDDPPRRIVLGVGAFDLVTDLDRQRAGEYARWEELSRRA